MYKTIKSGNITLALRNPETGLDISVPRNSEAPNVQIQYGNKTFKHTFEVIPLASNIQASIGMDLISKLGIQISGIATSWFLDNKSNTSSLEDTSESNLNLKPNDSPAGTEEQQALLKKTIQPLLDENVHIPKDSYCTVPEFIVELNTPEGVTSYRRQYDLPVASEVIVQETIDNWLADGTIEPAPVNTSWNSPITLAPKKDAMGNYTGKRPCLDPRHINKLLPDDRFPLPLIRDIFHLMKGATLFSTLDLKSAFHRFQIQPKDRHKTTFTFRGQQYMFRG